jgi:hypothetical protein
MPQLAGHEVYAAHPKNGRLPARDSLMTDKILADAASRRGFVFALFVSLR